MKRFYLITPNVLLCVLCFFLIVKKNQAQPYGYQYVKIISIDHTKVSGATNHASFPIYFKTIDPDLRTTGNGGHIRNKNGYDIIFTTSDCNVSLPHQVEKYDSLTGEFIAWINIPLLSVTTNTMLQMYYGNPGVTSSTSSTATWSSDFSAVYHLSQSPENTAPQMTDATSNAHSGTCAGGMTASNLISAKLGNGITFDEVNDYIQVVDFDYTPSFMISFWFQLPDNIGTSFQYLFSHGAYGVNESCNIYFGEDNLAYAPDRNMLKTVFQDVNDATSTAGLDAGTTFADGTWHYYTLTVGNSGGATIYIDGVQKAYVSFLGGDPYNPSSDIYFGSRSDLNSTRFLGGRLDEVHILKEPKSPDWIVTEFNNQNSPSTFYSIGVEQLSTITCIVLPITLIEFSAEVKNNQQVDIYWSTLAEINNDFYTVQRSSDAIHFESIGRINGLGTSNTPKNYAFTDLHPFNGVSYYRLKQTDLNGDTSSSNIKAVYLVSKTSLNVFPNPADDFLNIYFYAENEGQVDIALFTPIGQCILYKTYATIAGANNFALSLKNLPVGLYSIAIFCNQKIVSEKFVKK